MIEMEQSREEPGNEHPSLAPLASEQFPSLASHCSIARLPLPDFDKSAYRAADREEKEQLIKQVTEEAYELLAQDLKAGRSESLLAYLEAAGRFHQYSFNNMMLILLQRPDATRVAGFRAWNKFNRFVRKGEQGIVVLAPVTKVVGRHEETQADGSKKEVPIRRVVNTKPVYVFDVSQTDGDPLPEPERHAGDPGKYLSRLEKLYKKHGVTLTYVESLGGADGVSRGKSVEIVESLPDAPKFTVLVHELAHEMLHRDEERRKKTDKTIRETEAEAVAFIVGSAIGLEMGRASSDYIQLYRGDTKTLASSLHAIQDTAAKILSGLSF
tara:strand:- start:1731 stop:2708 length:978 start_codon:yes stop_codon:yes gene_type:complete